jgi:hypothetical protein
MPYIAGERKGNPTGNEKVFKGCFREKFRIRVVYYGTGIISIVAKIVSKIKNQN